MATPLPLPTLDHVVVNVRDQIDAGLECWQRLGFTMTPRGYHTLGSMNHLAILGSEYLELIAAAPGDTRRAEILAAPCGLNGLVFGTEDSAAVYQALDESGVPVEPPLEFSRPVELPGAAKDAQLNTLSEVTVGRAATLHHAKVAVDEGSNVHLGNWDVTLDAKATYRGFQFSTGLGLARNDINIVFAGEGGKLDLSGAYLVRGSEHVDTTLVVDHAVPACESRELFKGVLDGHGRGIFQGKIIVQPDAQKTDGKQMSQALMLSEDAEFDSKPELEIFADDVVCGHGATSAELDPDMLFYCRSRGIPESEARALMIESFIGEAIDKVEHPEVRTALMVFAKNWLAGSTRG